MNNASLELGGTNWAEKDGNILGYSVGDTSGKYSPQEFTFARGSNLSATRIDRAGLIVKGRENVLLQSNNFSNASWVKIRSSVSSGATDPFGGSNAWAFLTDTTADDQHYFSQSIAQSGVGTLSIYAKANGYNWLRLRLPSEEAFFDLANGVTGSSTTGISASMTNAGNGWYRCQVAIANMSTNPNVFIHIAEGDGDIIIGGTPSGTDGLYIYASQLEKGLAASPYIPTTTTSAQAGVLENTPRLNYTTGVANPYLLLEPSRTNLFIQSEYFGSSYWTKSGASVVSGFTSPEGLSNAYKLVEDTSTGGHQIFRRIVVTATDNYASLYAKPSGRDWIVLYDTYRDQGRYFNISTGVIGGVYRFAPVSEFIEPFQNGYYRIGIGVTSSTIDYQLQVLLADSDGGAVYTGDGTSGAYIYGAQLEAGSYPTSYIPTYSVSATRAQDVCNKLDASGEIGQTEGTMFLDISALSDDATNRRVTLSDGTATNRMYISYKNYTNQIRAEVISAGVSVFDSTYSSTDITQFSKIALAYKLNDFAFYVDGTQVSTDTSGAVPTSLTAFKFEDGSGGSSFFGNVNQAALYKERLTNAELATLTTI